MDKRLQSDGSISDVKKGNRDLHNKTVKQLMELILQQDEVFICGAHVRGAAFFEYLKELSPQLKVPAFLVSQLEENPSDVEGVPICRIDQVADQSKQCYVVIATKGENHLKLTKELEQNHFMQIIPLTPELDNELKKKYFRSRMKKQGKEFHLLEEEEQVSDHMVEEITSGRDIDGMQTGTIDRTIDQSELAVYMAVSIYDQGGNRKLDHWIRPIQVGAALTDSVICGCQDNVGDNISEKNKQYWELTAAYWIWKHAKEQYVGLCHYRRVFILDQERIQRILRDNIDVVLPVPTACRPSVADNYAQRHRQSDWIKMMELLHEDYPQYAKTAQKVFQDDYYYACNMWIMKKEVYDSFAAWLFEILGKLEMRCETPEDRYQGRYIGFLAERLTTLYFCHHWSDYRITHTDKLFLTDLSRV